MRDREGNVVLGYTSSSHLMLDHDLVRQDEVVEFAREYTKFHDLGTIAVFKTSDTPQVDLFGNRLGNYCSIFGKIISWDEIKWHVQEAYRLGMVKKDFLALRQFGSITLRLTAKNNRIPSPKPVFYFRNGDNRGVMAFLRHWAMCKNLGR